VHVSRQLIWPLLSPPLRRCDTLCTSGSVGDVMSVRNRSCDANDIPRGDQRIEIPPLKHTTKFLECFQNLRTRVTHAAVHNTHVAIAFNEFDYNVFASFSSTRAYVRACPRRHAHVCAACSVNSPLAKN